MNIDSSVHPTLGDWGEFKVINEVILPELRAVGPEMELGDDCAFLSEQQYGFGEKDLVVTTDVGPKPLVWLLGIESYWSWGWYSVVVNLSDLASAGASSLAFCSSIDAPSSLSITSLREFFRGIGDACKAFDTTNAGGNIRAAEKFACHGMGIGIVPKGLRIGRHNCTPGDIVVAIGHCGRYISAYLRAKSGSSSSSISDADFEILTRPIPRLREMQILAQSGVVCAATDNSDGILGSLWNIAERSCCGFEIDIGQIVITQEILNAASLFCYDPMNLLLCWGDWQVVACIRKDTFFRFEQLASEKGITYTRLGYAIDGPPRLLAKSDTFRCAMPVLRNENFSPTSFNANIETHLDYMLRTPLFNA